MTGNTIGKYFTKWIGLPWHGPLKNDEFENYNRRHGYTFCYPWCCLTKVSGFHSYGFSFRERSKGNAYVKLGLKSFKIPSRHNISIISLHFCQLLTLGIKILSCFPARRKRDKKKERVREKAFLSLFSLRLLSHGIERILTGWKFWRAFRCSVHTERPYQYENLDASSFKVPCGQSNFRINLK